MAQELGQTQQKRYDRQIRLWGEEGQIALGATSICLLNATATGTETLKNLVLPGNNNDGVDDDNILII